MKQIIATITGLVFGIGLSISGMANTNKVLDFLDIFGNWNPSLLIVMLTAIAVTMLGYKLVLNRSTPPRRDTQFYLPTNAHIDSPLVIGAAMFGIGWGLVGYCPGPAIASLASFNSSTLTFVLAMLTGMTFAHRLKNN